jgi:hypothetical protein
MIGLFNVMMKIKSEIRNIMCTGGFERGCGRLEAGTTCQCQSKRVQVLKVQETKNNSWEVLINQDYKLFEHLYKYDSTI